MSLAESAVRELCKSNPSSETVEYTTKDFVKTLDVSAPVHACEYKYRLPFIQ